MGDGDKRGSSLEHGSLLAHVEQRLPEIYLVLGLVVTSLLCFLTAPFFGPDEPDQSARAIALSHGDLMARMGPSQGGEEPGTEIDTGAVRAMNGMDDIREAWESTAPDFLDRPYGPVSEGEQRPLRGIGWEHQKVFLPFGNTAGYPPVLYLPAIAGWGTGEAGGLTIFESLRLARLLNALTAVGLGWLALRLCACSRWMLLPFLLLPSTLFLNASCSQDALLLAVAGLVAALLTRPLATGREFTGAELAASAFLLALCGTARPPYLGIALVLFLPGLELRREGPAGKDWRRWLRPGAAFAGVVAACGLWIRLVAPLGLEHSNEARPELQTVFLRAHSWLAMRALMDGTTYAVGDFIRRGVYVVGWNDLLPHHHLAAVLVTCIAVMVLFAPGCPIRTWRGRGLLALSVSAPLLGISLAEYIIWTPPGWHTVYGIQPRYWLPLLPLATMLLQGPGRPFLRESARTPVLLTAAAGLVAVACTLPWMAAHAFYNETILSVLRLNAR